MAKRKTSTILTLVFTTLYMWSLGSYAQELPVTLLDNVEVKDSRLSEYAIGARTTTIDSLILKVNQPTSLAQLLNDYSAAHIKSYGNGMLASISFRGTGPEHTAVLWHGVNIGYPMLGQSDLSLIPLTFSDQLQIQHGTGSSLYGTGAIGGTIAIGSARPISGLQASITQWAGSFGTVINNASLSLGNKNYFLKIMSTWDRSNNNFSFRNTGKIGEPIEVQENAGYERFGLAMESGIKTGKRAELQLSAQYLDMHRKLQPSMNVDNSSDWQDDRNIRFRTRYQFNGSNTDWYLQYAYLNNEIIYNGSGTLTEQHVFRAEVDQRFSTKLKGSIAFDHNLADVKAEFYTANGASETRTNIWASLLAFPLQKLILSANIRQGFHPVYQVPLSPSLGAEFQLIETNQSAHNITFMLARGFRIPTLNELYWEPGGNLELVPEDSYSAEVGFDGNFSSNVELSYDLTAYRMWVDNWILWRPTGTYWSPENIKEVDVYGIEASGKIVHSIGRMSLSWRPNYAYTRSVNRTGLDSFDRSVDKQLAYTPIHKGGLTIDARFKSWSVLINGVAIGKRFTTSDNENQLPAYFLLNLRAVKEFSIGIYSINVHASVNNILNTHYESVENRAMPGINYLIGINFNLTKP